MPTPADLKDGTHKRTIKALVVGPSGSGKTHFAATFPKCFFIMTEPGGDDTFTTRSQLLQNIVQWEYCIPQSVETIKETFDNLDKWMDQIRKMVDEGKIETVILDNITYLAQNRWLYIKHCLKSLYTSNQGAFNSLQAYDALAKWLFEFVLMKLLSLPCNVIITCHEKLENDEAMSKKTDKSTPIVPNIISGFRNDIAGMFSLVLYLTVTQKGGVYEYKARAKKGSQKNAKTRIELPEIINNVSYQTIIKEMNK